MDFKDYYKILGVEPSATDPTRTSLILNRGSTKMDITSSATGGELGGLQFAPRLLGVELDGLLDGEQRPVGQQANGEVLQVSATGPDGSVSLPSTLQAPDTTAPQPLTNLVLSNDGLVLSGRGEAGATVTVIGEGGVDLGTAVVDANGNFNVNLNSAQINGEQLSASQSDVAGNESNSVSLTAPDRVAPDAAGNLAFAGGGSLLNGTGEAGAAVRVLAADGSVLGSATVRADGTFQVNLASPQANGQQVQVVLTDAAGNQSAASAITAPDTTPPTAPGELAVSGDGVTLTGRGEVGARVTVTNPAVASLRLTSVFKSDNTDALLKALPSILPVAVRTLADGSQEIISK